MDPEAHITKNNKLVPNPNYHPLWIAHPLGTLVGSTALVKAELEAAEAGDLSPENFTTYEEELTHAA